MCVCVCVWIWSHRVMLWGRVVCCIVAHSSHCGGGAQYLKYKYNHGSQPVCSVLTLKHLLKYAAYQSHLAAVISTTRHTPAVRCWAGGREFQNRYFKIKSHFEDFDIWCFLHRGRDLGRDQNIKYIFMIWELKDLGDSSNSVQSKVSFLFLPNKEFLFALYNISQDLEMFCGSAWCW